jgi:sensor histidine kinase regulating citrate/malate metabolism
VAKERVSLMEEEKVLLEAIARARTKDEKQDLQKQLDEIRTMRRQLEKSLK